MSLKPDVEAPMLDATLQPKTRLLLEFHPIHRIPANEDGTGGGIRVRGVDARGEFFFDIVWGETTSLEVLPPL
jgi:hypothetical protein